MGKRRVFLGFSINTPTNYIPSFTNRTLTFIETKKHTFGSSHLLYCTIFRKYRIFWWFSKRYKTLDFKHYLWTHQHFICWRFSKYLYSQETSESREIMLSDGCSYFWMNQTILIFGNVMLKQCMTCKHYWLYYVDEWWRMLFCFIYIQCYGIQLSHDSPRTFPPSGSGVWHTVITSTWNKQH